jgi:hypothetical protein
MSDGLEQLRNIGAQKIHEKTHISREHVQAVLHETFDGLNKIQFLGFISILEREYDVDLKDLKAKGMSHFEHIVEEPIHVNTKVFTQPKKKKYYTYLYITLAVLVFVLFAYYDLFPSFGNDSQVRQIDNNLIENVKNNIEPALSSSNELNDSNEKEADDKEVKSTSVILNISNPEVSESSNVSNNEDNSKVTPAPEAAEVEKTVKIMPRANVWMGYIDIDTNKKYQKTFSDEFDLDTSKNWLLLFGHGNLDIEVNGELEKFNTMQNLRFKYINGELTKITIKEFKKLNKDSQW